MCNAGDGNTETYYKAHVKKQPMDLVKRTKQEEEEEDEEDQRAMVATGKSGVHLRDSRVVTKKRGMSTLVQPTNCKTMTSTARRRRKRKKSTMMMRRTRTSVKKLQVRVDWDV